MKTLTEAVMLLAPPGGLFGDTVLCNLFPQASSGARRVLLHRSVDAGEVLRLKPGLYCLAPAYRKTHPHPFTIAAALHSPSHISMESALSYHGLIPEAMMQVSSATIARSRTFDTPCGTFSFHCVPCNAPRAGVRAVKLDANNWACIATPLRAIADLVYVRREISWAQHQLRFLTESMRMEEDDLHSLPMNEYKAIHHAMRNIRTQRYLEGLKAELT